MSHDPGTAATLIGAYGAVASVLAVYELFALQQWADHCSAAETRAREVAEGTASTSLKRLRAKEDCDEALGRYPYWQVTVMMLTLWALAVLGWPLAHDLPHWARLYAYLPLALLTLSVTFATAAASRRTFRAVRKAAAAVE